MAGAGEVGVHAFMQTIREERVHFHVLRLKQSFLLWIGTEAKMKSLSVAMKSRIVGGCHAIKNIKNHFIPPNTQSNEIISSQLLGPPTDVTSTAMAQRLGMFQDNILLIMPHQSPKNQKVGVKNWKNHKNRGTNLIVQCNQKSNGCISR